METKHISNEGTAGGHTLYPHLVFVYGTLKRNEPNHDLITDGTYGKANFVGLSRTVKKYPLIIASRYNIPYLLHREGVGKNVVGELYRVDDEMLASMDELENNGKYYQRISVEVQPCGDQGVLMPWTYFLMNFREHLLQLPFLEDYTSKGDHGLEYVNRYKGPQDKDYYGDIQNVTAGGDILYPHLVFVYGTLKRNEPNHDLITNECCYVFEGLARTVNKYPLVIASRYNIPYLLHREGVGKNVVGELYRVDDAMLASMDELENNGKYYQRMPVEVQPCGDQGVLMPWTYFLMNFREHLLQLPHLEDYTSKGDHGLEYVSRYNRPRGEDYCDEVQN